MSFEEEKKGEEQDFFSVDPDLFGKQSKRSKEGGKKPQPPKELKKEEKKEEMKEEKKEAKKEAADGWDFDDDYSDSSWADHLDPSWWDGYDSKEEDDDLLF